MNQTIKIKFIKLYPTTPTSEVAKIFGISEDTARHWASKLKIKKDKNFISDNLRTKTLGREMSDKTKAKILATRLKNNSTPKGKDHYNWKGGTTWERFKNPEYINWRKAVLLRDNYKCQHCQKQCKKYEKGLAAHHIKSYKEHPELRLDISNGLTLCRECHMKHHGKSLKPKKLICCDCGCKTLIKPFDVYGRARKYVNFHGSKGKTASEHTKQILSNQRKGKLLSETHKINIKTGMEKSKKKLGRPKHR